MLHHFIEYLFPFTCYSCGLLGKALCSNCFHQFRFRPQKRQLLIPDSDGEIFEVISAHAYERDSVIAKLIYAYKYQHARELFRLLVPHLEQSFKQITSSNDWHRTIFVPIPLHRKKEHQRGYNQSVELSKALSRILGIPWLRLIKRVRHHEAQAGIIGKENRIENVKDVFQLDWKLTEKVFGSETVEQHSEPLREWNICLVDDVITTGATLLEARTILERAGFTNTFGLCLASREL